MKINIILIIVIIALLGYLKHQKSTIKDLKYDLLLKEKELNYEREKAIYLYERKQLDSLVMNFKKDTIHTTTIINKYENKSDSIISLGDSAVNSFITNYLDSYASEQPSPID